MGVVITIGVNMNYIEIFVSKLGNPLDEQSLINYIEFVHTSTLTEDVEEYAELHHILPRSIFGNNDHIFKLKYKDHVEAHRLLIFAYPIREFIRPLNFMLDRDDSQCKEYRRVISIAAKESWKKFKNTPEYEVWREKRSTYISNKMKDGYASELSNRRHDNNPNSRTEISAHFKALWAQPDFRAARVAEIRERSATEEFREKQRKISTDIWNSKSEDEKEFIRKRVTEYNKDPIKRANVSVKLKTKWQEKEYIEKMKNRPHGNNSEALKEKWADPEYKEKMREIRKALWKDPIYIEKMKNRRKKNETVKN